MLQPFCTCSRCPGKPDISVAKKHIGWQPQWTVGRGLAETISYFERELADMGGEIVPTGPGGSKPRPRAAKPHVVA